MRPLDPSFFKGDVVDVAQRLIGVEIHTQDCRARIVETEAYAAQGDEACHTATRPSTRSFIQENAPGTAYVYLNYGVHWLLNFLVKDGHPSDRVGLVLIRALEPLSGFESIEKRRKTPKHTQWCSGPGKLTQALNVDGLFHGLNLAQLSARGISLWAPSAEHALQECSEIIHDTRIGISKSIEFKWRFLVPHNPHVSVSYRGNIT